MKSNSKIFTILLIIFLSCSWLNPVFGSSTGLVSQELAEAGKIFYEKGEFTKAVHELSKALMVDPNNKLAQEYMKKLGVLDDFFGRQKTMALDSQLSYDIEELKRRLRQLEQDGAQKTRLNRLLTEDKEYLKRTVSLKEDENRILREEYQQIKTESKSQAKKDRSLLKEIDDISMKKSKEIARLNRDLDNVKSSFQTKVALLKEKDAQLKQIETDLRGKVADAQKEAEKNKFKYKELETSTKSSSKKISKLNQDLSTLKTKLDTKISLLKEKNQIITEKEKRIQEKDQEIQERDAALKGIEKDFQKKITQAEKQADARVKEVERTFRKEISQTKKQAESDRKALEKVEVESQKKSEKIATFADKEKNMRKELKEALQQASNDRNALKIVEAESTKKTEKIAYLNTKMYDYKNKLADTIKEVKLQKKYIKKLDYSRREDKRLWSKKTVNYEDRIKAIEREFDHYKNKTTKVGKERNEEITRLQEALRKKRQQLTFYDNKMVFQEYKMSDRDKVLAYKNRQISELKEVVEKMRQQVAYLLTKSKRQPQSSASNNVESRAADTQDAQEKIRFIKRQDRLISQLKEKLISTQKEISNFEGQQPSQETSEEDQKIIEALKVQLEEMHIKLKEREASLDSITQDYNVLEERLLDTQQRLELVDSIMKEKDGQIKELEQQLTEVLTEFDEIESFNLE